MAVIVEAKEDRMGGVRFRPRLRSLAKEYAEDVEENGGPKAEYPHDVYFNEGGGAQEFVKDNVPKKYHKDLRNGWTVRWRMDPWDVRRYYGWNRD